MFVSKNLNSATLHAKRTPATTEWDLPGTTVECCQKLYYCLIYLVVLFPF